MFHIEHEFRVYGKKAKVHAHQHGQMIIPTAGNLYIETKTIETEINMNNMIFLPPGSEHKYASQTQDPYLILDIPETYFKALDLSKSEGGKLIVMDEKWVLIKQLILKECVQEASPQALDHLFRYFYEDLISDSGYASVNYIHRHYNEKIKLKQLARIEGYTENYFCEWFKHKMNLSVSDYIRKVRIEKSKELLLTTTYTLIQIAQFVGYEHHSSFGRAFKAIEGMSPSEYRRLQGKEPHNFKSS